MEAIIYLAFVLTISASMLMIDRVWDFIITWPFEQ